ncbi:Alpha/beta hydrolase family protein [Pigmentiphaga humi]|uniref:Alpha/beta hydrolase family protein n=1 Tax=Pigmentiphaga humi TaxID=2478468 RepID=A0A3P4B8U2_9BURK|nr:alpha/beta fold hydrolase [Pigmentiphaga humi]VCU72040.1 Alpha/beta hydrolase family protein [Pigmentiphaga humi]
MSSNWSAEYTAKKGDVVLHIYRRCKNEPSMSHPRPVLFLVHGSSFAALPGYDLRVPGKEGYSMMDRCAEEGYDVWTMDHEGYGRSSRSESNSDIPSGADDLEVAAELIEKQTGSKSAMYYGQSSGSLRAALFAQRRPDRVSRVILDAFVWTGEGSRTLLKRREGLESYLASNRRAVTRESLHASLLRDDPQSLTVEAGVPDALADAALKDGDSVPSGTFVDMCSKLPLVDPAKIRCPVYIMRGEHDGIATLDDIIAFYVALPNNDKHFSMISNSAHIAPLGRNRDRFYQMMFFFLNLKPAD